MISKSDYMLFLRQPAWLWLKKNDLLIARSGSVGRTYIHTYEDLDYQWAGYLINFRINKEIALPEFVCYVTKSPIWWTWVAQHSKTGTLTNINAQEYSSFKVPLPPIEIQREIVAELEAEQKLVDANKKLIEIYQQKIKSKIAEVWGEWVWIRRNLQQNYKSNLERA